MCHRKEIWRVLCYFHLISQEENSMSKKECENEFEYENLSEEEYVKEVAEKYFARQGEYTLDDYFALPDDIRVELIDGYFFVMNSPTTHHQAAAGEIYRQIANFIIENNGKCQVYIAPTDVQINMDNRTMVEPDVFIVCNKDKQTKERIVGAPDFILEVLSKSTAKKDKIKKVELYKRAGVREYWMLDTEKRNLVIYRFDKYEYPMICGWDEPVPIGIYEGKLKIDFSYVKRLIDQIN